MATQELQHNLHGSDSEAELGLADGGERDTKILAKQNVSEANYRDIFRDSKTLMQKGLGTPDSHRVAHRLNGGRIRGLIDHLQGGFGAVIDTAAGLEHESIVHIQP